MPTTKRKKPQPKPRPTLRGYRQVPVTDVTMSDEEIPKNPRTIYDWVGIADKAVALARKKPGHWLLVDEDGSVGTASNITQGRIKTLLGERYLGWTFRGKVTEMKPDPETKRLTRAKIWIRADRSGVI